MTQARRISTSGVFLGVFVICILGFVTLAYAPQINLRANRAKWEQARPSSYYMEVREIRPGGSWHWMVFVSDSQTISVTLLEQSGLANSQTKSWLSTENLTVEHIFSQTEHFCTPRGIIKCGLSFDPALHYPKQVESYEVIVLEIDGFINCDQLPEICSSKLEDR